MDKHALPETVNFAQIWQQLKRRKWLGIFIVILGMAATVAYTSYQPVLYRSSASLLIENFVPNATQVTNPYPDIGISQDVMKANRSLAESYKVVSRARALARQRLKESDNSPNVEYQAMIEGQLVYLHVLDPDPVRAAEYANAWSDAFVEAMRKISAEPVIDISRQYDKVVPELRKDWQEKLEKLHTFQQDYNFDPKDFERSPIYKKIEVLHTQMNDAWVRLDSLKTNENWLKNKKPVTFDDVMVMPSAKEDLTLKASKDEFEKRRAALAEALENNKETSDIVKAKRESLAAARQDLDAMVAKFMDKLDGEIAILDAHYKDLVAECDKAERIKQDLVKQSLKWSILDKSVRDAEQVYSERFRDKFTADFSKQIAGAYAKSWESAQPAETPALPNWRRSLVAGFLLSSIAATIFIVLLDRLDDSVRTSSDLSKKPGLTTLGMIPLNDGPLDELLSYRIVDERSFSMVAEAIRNLHISLEVKYGNRHKGKALVLTITSSLANEGKTMVASNLALLFAGLGRKTLIVDADARKRSLTNVYNLEGPGLAEFMAGAPWTATTARQVGASGLYVLPAGGQTGQMPETIRPEVFEVALTRMTADFEVIIIDTPPVLPMADACIMGHLSDATVMVIRSRRTSLRQLDTAIGKLSEAKVKDILCVVNGVDASDGGEVYGYGYGQLYGYGLDEKSVESQSRQRSAAQRRPVKESV